MAKKEKTPNYSDTEIRKLMLQFFYDKNKNATSIIGKKSGAANTISVIRRELKEHFGLKAQQVVSNLTYLLSQGWIEPKEVGKAFSTPKGSVVPSITTYYVITAAGIDKIDGPTEFTPNKFAGIKIEATGQNIITLGDGNQVNSKFENVGNALNDLKNAVKDNTVITEEDKVDIVSDIDSIQDQLAKPKPNKTVITTLWSGLGKLATIEGIMELYQKAEPYVRNLLL
ncbi:MAG: hypothetical protein K8I03_09670 [Ignavibacteria bacterium]|nr:hypothetical protein [Ignavibacteria bacterium]